MARLTLHLGFGPGRSIEPDTIRLLEAVRDHGSISAAGKQTSVSYRHAWLLVDLLNRMFTEPVIKTKHGGVRGGGAELTPFGQRLVEHYRTMERKASAATAAELAELAAAAVPARAVNPTCQLSAER